MAKIAEAKHEAATSPAPSEPQTAHEAASRFRCLDVAEKTTSEDDDAFEDDDGFQCPCCLPR